jgi:hypothetical protein
MATEDGVNTFDVHFSLFGGRPIDDGHEQTDMSQPQMASIIKAFVSLATSILLSIYLLYPSDLGQSTPGRNRQYISDTDWYILARTRFYYSRHHLLVQFPLPPSWQL